MHNVTIDLFTIIIFITKEKDERADWYIEQIFVPFRN